MHSVHAKSDDFLEICKMVCGATVVGVKDNLEVYQNIIRFGIMRNLRQASQGFTVFMVKIVVLRYSIHSITHFSFNARNCSM